MAAYTFILSTVFNVIYSAYYNLFLNALRNSLGCLDFWHGMEWDHKEEAAEPLSLAATLADVIETWYKLNGKSGVSVGVRWTEGVVSLADLKNGRFVNGRQIKLGKLLAKMKKKNGEEAVELTFGPLMSLERICQKFENRETSKTWRCVFTTHPADVWSMSHKKGWTSCTGHKGCYHKGVYTDVLAGSGILYFFSPGKKSPSGREIIRPAVDNNNNPVLLRTGRIYGAGPELSDKELSDIFNIKVITGKMEDFVCLCEEIYDDVARQRAWGRIDVKAEEILEEAFGPYCEDEEAKQMRKCRTIAAQDFFDRDRQARKEEFKSCRAYDSYAPEMRKSAVEMNARWFKKFAPGEVEMWIKEAWRNGDTNEHDRLVRIFCIDRNPNSTNENRINL